MDLPPELRHGACCHGAAPIIGCVIAAWMAVGAQARAADLAGDLMVAARADHDPAERRRACSTFEPMTIRFGLGNLADAERTGAVDLSGLPADTKGVHLADGPTGAPAPSFIQALLDAGVATRLAPGRMRTDRQALSGNDAFVVMGPDRVFFPNEHPYGSSTAPTTEEEYNDPAGTIAPGFWTTRHVCVVLVPARILEYSDVRDIGNGFTEVTAALLFRPRRLPSWVTDPRVIQALYPQPRPWSVRVSTFRNDGSGWRQLPGSSGSLEYMTHIVPAEGP